MQTFQKRIGRLLEGTKNPEIKEYCTQVLEMSTYVPEVTLRTIFLDKIRSVGADSLDEEERKAISIEEKIDLLQDLGLSNFVKECRSSGLYDKPSFTYGFLSHLQVIESKQYPAFMIAETIMNAAQPFTFDPTISEAVGKVREILEGNSEDILIANVIYQLDNSKGREFYKPLVEKLSTYLFDKNPGDRLNLISEMQKYGNEQCILEGIEGLKWLQKKEGRSFEVMGHNHNFVQESLYSLIYETPEKDRYFRVGNNHYKLTNEGKSIDSVGTDEYSTLPESYRSLSEYTSSRNIVLNESGVSIYVGGKHKIFFDTTSTEPKIFLNETEVTQEDLRSHFIDTRMFGSGSVYELNSVNALWENAKHFCNINYGKRIRSKIYEGVEATLFNIDGKLYARIINPGLRINEWHSEINGTQLRNRVLEAIGYDLRESLAEFLDGDDKIIAQITEQRKVLANNIHMLNGELERIRNSRGDILMEGFDDKFDLLEAEITNSINSYKSQHAELSQRLESFTHIQESEGSDNSSGGAINEESSSLRPDDRVRVISSGKIGKIYTVDGFSNKILILTDEGQSISAEPSDVEKIEDTEPDINTIKGASKDVSKVEGINEGKEFDKFKKWLAGSGGRIFKPSEYDAFNGTDQSDAFVKSIKGAKTSFEFQGICTKMWGEDRGNKKYHAWLNDYLNEEVDNGANINESVTYTHEKRQSNPKWFDAYSNGFTDGFNKKSEKDNPYKDENERAAWQDGWNFFNGKGHHAGNADRVRKILMSAITEEDESKANYRIVEGVDTQRTAEDGFDIYESGTLVYVLENNGEHADKVGAAGTVMSYDANGDTYEIKLQAPVTGIETKLKSDLGIKIDVFSVRAMPKDKALDLIPESPATNEGSSVALDEPLEVEEDSDANEAETYTHEGRLGNTKWYDAYSDGFTAGFNKKTEKDNPYKDKNERAAWQDGWNYFNSKGPHKGSAEHVRKILMAALTEEDEEIMESSKYNVDSSKLSDNYVKKYHFVYSAKGKHTIRYDKITYGFRLYKGLQMIENLKQSQGTYKSIKHLFAEHPELLKINDWQGSYQISESEAVNESVTYTHEKRQSNPKWFDAYSNGFTDGFNKKSEKDNPYKDENEKAAWQDGWNFFNGKGPHTGNADRVRKILMSAITEEDGNERDNRKLQI